jgi:hypothetical protein
LVDIPDVPISRSALVVYHCRLVIIIPVLVLSCHRLPGGYQTSENCGRSCNASLYEVMPRLPYPREQLFEIRQIHLFHIVTALAHAPRRTMVARQASCRPPAHGTPMGLGGISQARRGRLRYYHFRFDRHTDGCRQRPVPPQEQFLWDRVKTPKRLRVVHQTHLISINICCRRWQPERCTAERAAHLGGEPRRPSEVLIDRINGCGCFILIDKGAAGGLPMFAHD